jgi:hypothetical protein
MKQKGLSGKGRGKWQTPATLARYRARRNKANRAARASRRTNR